jgi:hypothetical protein
MDGSATTEAPVVAEETEAVVPADAVGEGLAGEADGLELAIALPQPIRPAPRMTMRSGRRGRRPMSTGYTPSDGIPFRR